MERNTQGSPCALQELPICKHPEPKMQSPTKMNTIGSEDYHMTKMDENVNWMKPTHLSSSFPLSLRAHVAHLL